MDDSIGCSPLMVRFARSAEPFGNEETVKWSFGTNQHYNLNNLNLGIRSLQNPDTIEKIIKVKLSVQYGGCEDSVIKKIRVFPVPLVGIIPLTSANLFQKNPTAAFLENILPQSAQWVRHWDFGDGKDTLIEGGINDTIYHRYDTVGIYQVKLKVMDYRYPDTCFTSKELNLIKVLPSSPIADFLLNGEDNTEICELDTVTFINKSRFVTKSASWDFGNGIKSPLLNNELRYQTQSTIYPKAGTYKVKLIVQNDMKNALGRDTLIKESAVIVHPKPKTNFTVEPDIRLYPITPESEVLKTKNLSIGGAQFLWNFGEFADTLSAFDTSYKYTIPGEYTISLVSISNKGCRDTFNLKPTMNAQIAGLWVPDVFSPNGDGLNDNWEIFHINVIDFQLFVYNQWGEQIFYSKDPNKRWDGTFSGKSCQNGGYNFYINYALDGLNGKKINMPLKKGIITIKN